MKAKSHVLVSVFVLYGLTSSAFAQAAGAGASFNRADFRATLYQAEVNRLTAIDKPVYKDALGNSMIAFPSTTLLRGVAAGVRSVITGTAIGMGKNAVGNR